jgi:GNAT superfamily N-acetyltransferase
MVSTGLAGSEDRTAVAALVAESVGHLGATRDAGAIEEAAAALTAPHGRIGPFCILARDGTGALGFAAFSGLLPVEDGRWGLFLQLLFVTARARGKGVSRLLMAALARFAVEGGYIRLDWNAIPGNAPALGLYASLGLPVFDRVYYRLQGDRLAEAAATWPERLT